jgi:hypothetical protein
MCFKLQNRGGWLVWQSRNGGSGGTTYRRVCVWRALSAAVGASRLHGQLECLAVAHMALLQGRQPRLVLGGSRKRGCEQTRMLWRARVWEVLWERRGTRGHHKMRINDACIGSECITSVLEMRAAAAGRAREARC